MFHRRSRGLFLALTGYPRLRWVRCLGAHPAPTPALDLPGHRPSIAVPAWPAVIPAAPCVTSHPGPRVPNPELDARTDIDRQLEAAGWLVQDYKEIHLGAPSAGIAVREYPLATGRVDYLLYANGRVIGTVEAKPVGHTLSGVEIQSEKYVGALHPDIPTWRNPIPFAYESTGVETQFTNGLDPEPRSRRVFTFHRPEELLRLVGEDLQLRGQVGVGL